MRNGGRSWKLKEELGEELGTGGVAEIEGGARNEG